MVQKGNLLTTTSDVNFSGAEGELFSPSDAGRDSIQVKLGEVLSISELGLMMIIIIIRVIP